MYHYIRRCIYVIRFNVGGFPVTGMTSIGWSLCELLGVEIPTEAKDGNFLKILWLKKTFIGLAEDESVDKKIQHTRAHILILIGGFFISKYIWRYSVHCSLLTLLPDFNQTRQYSWGSAVLATLYRGLCEASQAGYATLSGCTFLLQVWAYSRLDYIAPQTRKEFTFPFAT